MDDLTKKHCVPCKKGSLPLKGEQLHQLCAQLKEGWKLIAEHHLEKTYEFKNFKDALSFVNRIGEIAQREGHHPDLHLSWGKVTVLLWTHKIDGLTESDFILASKID